METNREVDEALLVSLLQMSGGEAPPEQYAELGERVVADRDLCDRVVRGLSHLADLEWEASASGAEAPAPEAPFVSDSVGAVAENDTKRFAKTSSPRNLTVYSTAAGLLIAFLAGAVGSQLLPTSAPVDRVVVLPPPPSGGGADGRNGRFAPVATLVRNTSYILEARAGTPMGSGAVLHAGSLVSLFDGIAELEIDSGVSVLLKGPAILEFGADGEPVLKYGGLVTRHVPEQSWRLAIPMAEVEIAAGSIVGIDAFGDEAVIHALEGEAAVHPTSGDNPSVALASGEALRLRRDARSELVVLPIAAKPESFDFEARMDDGHLELPADYAEQVMRSRPAAYWRFDRIDAGAVVDEAGGKHTLQLIGEGVQVLRGAGNSYVSFAVRKNRGCFASSDPLDAIAASDYAVEFWFKPHHYHRGSIVSLVDQATDDRGLVELHGLIIETNAATTASPEPEGVETSPKAIRFLHRSPPDELLSGVTCFSGAPYRLNAWQHVAAVKDGESLRLYIDGKLTCEAQDNTMFPRGLSIVIGQLYSFGSVRPFVGELDELAFYSHALSETEIATRLAGVNLHHRQTPQSEEGVR